MTLQLKVLMHTLSKVMFASQQSVEVLIRRAFPL